MNTVLVNGLGNIGTTLVNVLLQHKGRLGIDRVLAYKNQPQDWQTADLQALVAAGAEVIVAPSSSDDPVGDYFQQLRSVDYVFETREHGLANALKSRYQEAIAGSGYRLQAVCAQGSEKGFGVPFMAGLDPTAITLQPLVTVVSCNTHAIAALLQTLCGEQLENLQHADAVVVRRSEDLGSNGRLVAANVVARHLDPVLGTHHAIDATDLFNSIGVAASISSSDITTPSQVMHALRFNLHCNRPMSHELIQQRLAANPLLATTHKFDSAAIMAQGRRYGFQGRIYSHAVVVNNQLQLNGNTMCGWAFVPQEACTIISTVQAYYQQVVNNPHSLDAADKNAGLLSELCRPAW